jgi:hypothetical protein
MNVQFASVNLKLEAFDFMLCILVVYPCTFISCPNLGRLQWKSTLLQSTHAPTEGSTLIVKGTKNDTNSFIVMDVHC